MIRDWRDERVGGQRGNDDESTNIFLQWASDCRESSARQALATMNGDSASSIVATIQPTLVGAGEGAARRHGGNIAAFELYLKGRHLWLQRTPQSIVAATAYFERRP